MSQALNVRIQRTIAFPGVPEEEVLWLHLGLAHSVEQGLPEAAETFSRAILEDAQRSPARRYAVGRALEELDLGLLDAEDRTGFQAVIEAIAA